MLHQVPNLTELIAPHAWPPFLSTDTLDHSIPYLPLLEHVTAYLSRPADVYNTPWTIPFDTDDLAQFAQLPSLKRLRIRQLRVFDLDRQCRNARTILSTVTTLEVHGEVAFNVNVKVLAAACPSLLHLVLCSTNDKEPVSFEQLLPHLTPNLHSLKLQQSVWNESPTPNSSLLQQFTQLRSLSLDSGCYDRDIPETLAGLPLLKDIHLGGGSIDFEGLRALVAGSSRLLFLQSLSLSVYRGTEGRRISSPSSTDFDAIAELDSCPANMDDWTLPEDEKDEEGEDQEEIDMAAMRSLVNDAKKNGIKISGSVLRTLRIHEEYFIEANNREIVNIHSSQGYLLESRRQLQLAGRNLPKLELLDIVETPLPERDWFILSLERRLDRVGMGLRGAM
ncbi:hypothetical protein JCM5353_006958 [Sporobolomyces roseus]